MTTNIASANSLRTTASVGFFRAKLRFLNPPGSRWVDISAHETILVSNSNPEPGDLCLLYRNRKFLRMKVSRIQIGTLGQRLYVMENRMALTRSQLLGGIVVELTEEDPAAVDLATAAAPTHYSGGSQPLHKP